MTIRACSAKGIVEKVCAAPLTALPIEVPRSTLAGCAPTGRAARESLPGDAPRSGVHAPRDAAFGDIVAGTTTPLHPQPESPMPEFPPNPWEDSLIADIRANGGRPSSGPLAGHPLLLLYSTGAKSGQRRRSILTYSRDGDDYIVAGTANGAPKDPAWVANVRANPDVTIEVAGVEHPASATIVDEAERRRLWDHHVEQLPWFGDYPKQTTRTIPVIRLRTSS
jgi:deazaflavin-dependent oxidoreductase (nitroreductase family)